MATYTNKHGVAPSPPLGPSEPKVLRFATFIDPITQKQKTVKYPSHQQIIERAWREEIDEKQCQAPSGIVTMKGKIGTPSHIRSRCHGPATVVAVENVTRADGITGGMALCPACAARIIKTHGADYATITPIVKTATEPAKT